MSSNISPSVHIVLIANYVARLATETVMAILPYTHLSPPKIFLFVSVSQTWRIIPTHYPPSYRLIIYAMGEIVVVAARNSNKTTVGRLRGSV